MNLRPLIDDIASQADDFLAGCQDRAQARAGISEFLALEHPRLRPADRKLVIDQVMAVLEEEDVFPERFVDSFDADQEPKGDDD
jgi:hypothetical protein